MALSQHGGALGRRRRTAGPKMTRPLSSPTADLLTQGRRPAGSAGIILPSHSLLRDVRCFITSELLGAEGLIVRVKAVLSRGCAVVGDLARFGGGQCTRFMFFFSSVSE